MSVLLYLVDVVTAAVVVVVGRVTQKLIKNIRTIIITTTAAAKVIATQKVYW